MQHTYLGKETENERFEKALAEFTRSTQAVCTRIRSILGTEEAEIFKGHIYMANDPEIKQKVTAQILRGFNAEMATESACNYYIERFLASDEELTKQRAADIRDVKKSFLNILSGSRQTERELPVGSVIAARELTPSAVSFLDRRRTAAVLTETGGRNSHLAILLRAMGIPAVFSVSELMKRVNDGQKVIVDGDKGEIIPIE